MNKQRKTSHILNVFQYDPVTSVVTLPSGLVLPTPDSAENSTKVATTAWIRAYVGSLSYATVSAVDTAIANLVASAPTTLNTLNELATALGNDPNFATTISTSIGTKVPQSRTITINGTAYDLSADRAWTIASGVTSFNTRTGAITLTSGDVTGALGYTPYNSSNPSGYISGITSLMVTNALGFTPYNSSNPAGYITASSLSSYLPLSGGNLSGNLRLVSISGNDQMVENTYGAYLHLGGWAVGRTDSTAILVNTAYRADYADALFDMNISRFTNNSGYVTSSGSVNYANSAGTLTAGATTAGTLNAPNGYSFVALGYNNNGGFAMNNGGQYWGLMWNMSTNDWRLGRGSQTAQNGWNLRWDSGDNVFINQHLYLNNNYGSTIVGAYSSTVYQGIFAMGDAYKLPLNGSSPGSLYGLAWSHPNAGGVAGNLNTHGLLVMENGTFLAAISGNIKARDGIIAGTYMFAPNYIETNGPVYATIMYDNNDRSFYVDPNSTSRLNTVVYNDLKWVGDQSYGFIGRNVYADTINGIGSDPLEINYYGGGNVIIGTGANGSKSLLANALYDSGNRVAISRGEGRNYVDYSRYVYNNGAYSGSGWIEPSDLGVRYANSAGSASSASVASYLSPNYVGGAQYNPQVYFNYSLGLKVAMTGAWSVWSDTLWINGYTGGDVPWMCALHFLRNSEPRFAISAQTRDSGGYGSYYEVITAYNVASQKVDGSKKLWAASHPNDYYIVNNWTGSYWQLTTNHGSGVQVAYANDSGTASNLSGFDKTNPSFGAVYASNWFRAQGDCGLYSQDYGGHFRRNVTTYGTWQSFGYAKNGWGGYVSDNNYILSLMNNSSGDSGFYQENGGGWILFYNRGNHCWGIGTDNTWSGDGLRCVKQVSAEYGYTTWSDRRAKENITSITGALDKVLSMNGVYFNYIKDDQKTKRVGFIAQELQLVLPEAVNYAEEIDEYNVNYGQIVSVIAEAMKEQDAKMKAQEATIQRLEQLVEQLINQ